MPATDALALSGVLAGMGVTALAAGFVGGLLCSIRERNRRSAVTPCEPSAGGSSEDAFRTNPSSVPGRGAKEESAW